MHIDEPLPTKTGYHLFHWKGEPYLLACMRMVRGRKVYTFVYPKIQFTGTWEECIEEIQLWYVRTHKPARRRRV